MNSKPLPHYDYQEFEQNYCSFLERFGACKTRWENSGTVVSWIEWDENSIVKHGLGIGYRKSGLVRGDGQILRLHKSSAINVVSLPMEVKSAKYERNWYVPEECTARTIQKEGKSYLRGVIDDGAYFVLEK